MSIRFMDLDFPSNMEKFKSRLDQLQYAHASRYVMTESQARFVEEMKVKLDRREDDFDITQRKWNPTVNQWNYLSGIFDKL